MLQQCGPNAAASSLPLVQGLGMDLKLQLEFGFVFGLGFGIRIRIRMRIHFLVAGWQAKAASTHNWKCIRLSLLAKSFVCIALAHPIAAPFPLHNPRATSATSATSATAATSAQLATCGACHYLICIWLDLARNGNLPQNDDKAHWIELANFSLLAIVRHPVPQSIISGVTMSNFFSQQNQKAKPQNHRHIGQNLTISHNIFGLVW